MVVKNLLEARAFEQTRELVAGAVKQKYNPNPGDRGPWGPYITQTFSDKVIYEWDSKMFEAPYEIDVKDGVSAVTLGNPIEVQVTYAPITESITVENIETAAEFAELVEKELRNNTMQIKVIQPGWGSTGYYSPQLLERDGPVAFTKGTKMYWDHPTVSEAQQRPERSLRDLAGEFITDARWLEKGPAGAGLYANAKIFEAFAPHVKSMAEHIGVSIRASGTAKQGEAEGRKGRVIESIVAAKSVDFVTVPGAGGQIVSLFEAARPSTNEPEEVDVDEAKVQEMIEAATKPLTEQLTSVTAERDRLLEGQLMTEGKGLIVTQVNASALPAVTKLRLIESLSPRTPIKEGKVDSDALKTLVEGAIKDEAEYLARITGSPVKGMNSSSEVETQESSENKKTPDLEKTFQALGLSEAASKTAAVGR
jgi:hypothetical protein